MNKRQRIVITIGIFLVILSGLFPSYDGEYLGKDINMKKYMGYYFLFLPPTEKDVYEAFIREPLPGAVNYMTQSAFSSYIITSRFWVQVVTVVIATLGLFVLFGEKRNE